MIIRSSDDMGVIAPGCEQIIALTCRRTLWGGDNNRVTNSSGLRIDWCATAAAAGAQGGPKRHLIA